MFASSFAFTVFLLFLLLATQVTFGLYTRTTVTAIATDLAQEIASSGRVPEGADAARWSEEGRRRLGDYGDRAAITVGGADVDADGTPDTVTVRVTALLPALLPARWRVPGDGTVTRTARARLEVLQDTP